MGGTARAGHLHLHRRLGRSYDCRTPVCERVATPATTLMTFDENKVDAFEKSPCGLINIWPLRPVPDEFRGAPGEPGGYYASRGYVPRPTSARAGAKPSTTRTSA